ncbi:LysR family transcriptional regulator [Salipaludibacillus sp. LMS25]|jgi:DNA-binding transcriptional LysR family regulator|uniref:LysR family transcriptional regulator n=1 Tax=Salipaludibacillus sp. LMS25 TaxID=2924031 RepID=UPI0020D03E36|nr:LysR family transcriptional regulator [Salipaludibacillus sp. LMS25]UTR16508.1 LysR family transcriptional regulator [Salipaludibacillus sp. LMS25]
MKKPVDSIGNYDGSGKEMDIKQLTTFQVASKTLSFTKAAAILNYAQSTVTSQIKSLETELGVNLFERLGNKLVLTAFGEKFRGYSDTIISQYQAAIEDINYDKNMTSTIVVGATESQCAYKLPDVLKELRILFPKVKVIIKPIHKYDDIQSELQSGNLDFAFIFGEDSIEWNNIKVSKLSKGKLVFVASPVNKMTQLENLKLKDLIEETLILTEKGCSYRNLLEGMLSDHKITFNSTFEITNIETLKNCVKSDLGIALLPYEAVKKEVEKDELRFIDWAQGKEHDIYHFISWHKDKNLTPLLSAFISVSEAVF